MTTTQLMLVLRHVYERARRVACERSKSTGHVSTRCSQGSDNAFRESARSYNNALSLTSLAAHVDQTQLGT
ncbi:BQ5605_C001g00921 [Microbotryum silenes-dioicae]|uniref:BQ5605_C001g00921 protein n=1 Tax=Microbotryum silenes-dioicae TaxID=796604 RepID=A0A2X0P120_9BASI|nr:BQ5605_C001g00921 [Microbotryum silenes-dioicae]